MIAKADLRAACLERRRGRPAAEVVARSARLTTQLTTHPWWRAATRLAAFVGVQGEPDTRPLLTEALASGKRVWLPRMTGPRRALIEFVELLSLADLAPAPFGLLEPRTGPGVALTELDLDLALVPGLMFTRDGVRLGFGKGHYDRALADLRAAARPLRVGVCFAEELGEGLPHEAHDVPMHAVLTEEGFVRCGPLSRPAE